MKENPNSGGWSEQQARKSKLLIFSKNKIKNWGILPMNFPYLGVLWRIKVYFFRNYEFGIKLLIPIKSEVCVSASCVMQVSFPLKLINAFLGG